MKVKCLYIVLLLTGGFILNSCSSTVRFSSGKNELTEKKKAGTTKEDTRADSRNTPRPLTNNTPKAGQSMNTTTADNPVIKEAERWIGVPYKWGGRDSAGTDCSGFVQSVYKTFGLSLPRTASDQYSYSQMIAEEEAVPGDLIFFRIDDKIVHVGLYAGNNRMIHASTKAGVIFQDLNKYLYYTNKTNIAGFGRVATQ